MSMSNGVNQALYWLAFKVCLNLACYISTCVINLSIISCHIGVGNSRAARAHFGSDHAELMCRTNLRFLIGCMCLLGYDSSFISLDMFALEHIVRELESVLEGRSILAGRKYQLYQELRVILWWIADRMREAASTAAALLENPRTVLPSFHFVEVIHTCHSSLVCSTQ